jgi:hypothetical protein
MHARQLRASPSAVCAEPLKAIADNFFPQASTQWDGFGHFGHSTRGFFGGQSMQEVQDDTVGLLAWSLQDVKRQTLRALFRQTFPGNARRRAGDSRPVRRRLGPAQFRRHDGRHRHVLRALPNRRRNALAEAARAAVAAPESERLTPSSARP